jgi:hypothetical protein
VKAFEEKVSAWLKRVARRISKIDIPTAETTVLDSVRKAVAMSHGHHD